MGRIKQPIKKPLRVALGVIGVVALAIFYSYLSHQQHIKNPDDTTLPNLKQLVEGLRLVVTPRENSLAAAFGLEEKETTFLGSIKNTWLFQDAVATYGRLFKGLLWGCGLAVILGTLMGCYEKLAAILAPPLSYLAKVPGTAMLAVFFVIVGTGEPMFVAMIGFGVLPTLTHAIYLSARDDIHEEEIDKAYTLGASSLEVIWNVVFRQILPKILDAVRLQIGPAMVFLIAAEMLVGQVGMGYQIRMQQRLLHMNIVYNYLLILGLTGLFMDRGMIVLREWSCPWYGRS